MLARRNILNHLSTLNAVRTIASRGNATRADIAQARSRLEAARAQLAQRTGALLDAEARYIETVGRRPTMLADPGLSRAKRAIKLQSALARGNKNNPSIAAARNRVMASRFGAKSTKGLLMPRVNLELSATSGDNIDGTRGNTSDLRALVVLRWNLYRGGADTARRRQAKFDLDAARSDERDARRLVRQRIRQAHAALVSNQQRRIKAARQVAAARQVLSYYRDQFRLGQRSLVDLLDAQNEVFTAQEVLLDARYTILFNYYALLAATGELLTTLGNSANQRRHISRWRARRSDVTLVAKSSELGSYVAAPPGPYGPAQTAAASAHYFCQATGRPAARECSSAKTALIFFSKGAPKARDDRLCQIVKGCARSG